MDYVKTVEACFTAQVNATPDTIAVSDGNTQLSYREINEKASQLAHWLREQGVVQGDFVGLLFEPHIEFVVWVLAIIKAGAAYISLDTQAPAKRLEYIINDAKPKLVITNLHHIEQAPAFHCPLYKSQQILLLCNSYLCTFDSTEQNPEAPLCLFYTSGTTGKPKGVIISHQAVVNLNKVSNFFNIGQSDVVAQFSNLAFDAVTVELWSTLLRGATLLFVPSSVQKNNQQFKQFLIKHKANSIFLPTSYFNQLIELATDAVDSLKTIFFGGEAINIGLIKKFLLHRRNRELPVKLINAYGPTEATTVSCYKVFDLVTPENDLTPSIGNSISNVKTYILNKNLQQVIRGEPGELYISGVNLAIGYLNSPELNKKKFIPNPFCKQTPFERMYKTGDLVKEMSNGELQYVGRTDDQVKISGFRVHLNEIEAQLLQHPDISMATVLVEKAEDDSNFLVAYLVFSDSNKSVRADVLSQFLSLSLSPYMLPVKYLKVEQLPLNANGKIDKLQIRKISYTDLSGAASVTPVNRVEEKIKSIWEQLLNIKDIDVSRNLFELGANSLMLMSACFNINQALQCELSVGDMVSYPSIRLLSQYLGNSGQVVIERRRKQSTTMAIAIVGMACRFPQADSPQTYWDNLCANRDCLTRFANTEAGANFIPVRGIVADTDQFDAPFFGLNPVDASMMDPQQRLFLTCAWEAFEQAGIVPEKNARKKISAFCGMADSSYLQENILKNQQFRQQNDWLTTRISTSIGTLSTQLSYRLNLYGKSVNINTACSTSLVAVTQACQELMSGQSEIAVAGGVSIDLHHRDGYFYQENGIESADGQCRPFAADANGTVFSDGVGVVILKRLADAVQDGDTIYAVIKGCGINNDGANKLGYTAPSVEGQARCLQEALIQSGLTAGQMGLIEAHGTATTLGDVIEFKALTQAYKNETGKTNYCALGSVKGNIGHTDIAAGMAGLIKAALCLYHKKIPPTRHFHQVNPHINLEQSPFYINDRLIDWESDQSRYAGVSAFGIGGTNAHLILAEHVNESSPPDQPEDHHVFIVSAKTKKALKQNADNLAHFLVTASQKNKHGFLADAAYTLQTGRQNFQWRSIAVGRNSDEIVGQLNNAKPICVGEQSLPVVFMFSGQGTQYPEMALSLLNSEPYFASVIEQVRAIANNHLKQDLLMVIRDNPGGLLHQTHYTQPALFMIEYALAKLLMHHGVQPQAMIGHSIGEYVAACLACVFSLEDAIRLLCQRGLFMEQTQPGSMLAVECTMEEFYDLAGNLPVELALHNSLQQCVASGSEEAIDLLIQRLTQRNRIYSRLKVSHAFHSRQMESASHELVRYVSGITLSAPQIPVISNVTGRWLTEHEATSPDYWATHLRQTVLFKEGIDTLIKENYACFIEVGPGKTLATWTKEIHQEIKKVSCVTHMLPNHQRTVIDQFQFLTALGELWQHGLPVDWAARYSKKNYRHIPLPTYAFQQQRYWIEPDAEEIKITQKQSSDGWLYQPTWVRQQGYQFLQNNHINEVKKYTWIIFKHPTNTLHPLISILHANQVNPVLIEASNAYEKINSRHYLIDVSEKSHYDKVWCELKKSMELPPMVLHLLSCNQNGGGVLSQQQIEASLNNSYYSALWAVQTFIEHIGADVPLKYALITQQVQQVSASDRVSPVKASLLGINHVVPQECALIKVQLIDVNNDIDEQMTRAIVHRCLQEEWITPSSVTTLRDGYQWERIYTPVQPTLVINRFKDNGVYLCTGGLGGVALTLCESIADEVSHPIFVLLSRRCLPAEEQWDAILCDQKNSWHSTVKILQRLQHKGALIEVIQCDITRQETLDATINHITRQYGQINGLIHAAGVAGGSLVQRNTKHIASQVFAPKIHGTYYLAKALQPVSLDFVMLCSSIGSLVGITGLADYGGANACLDAFAESHLFHSDFVVSVNWNTWKSIGMAVETKRPEDIPFFNKGNDIEPEQAQKIFIQIMRSHYSNVAVSCFDIGQFAKIVNQPQICNRASLVKFDREELPGDLTYVAPMNAIESQLVELWQTMLGIEPIGVEDDFFILGGHSLKALNFIETANKKFNGKLSLQDLYQEKTIARLARKITSDEQSENTIVKLAMQPDNIGNVFMLHPVAGTVFCFDTIASHWNSPFNLYGLQDPGVSTGELQFSSLPDMARFYLDKIKQLQPHGPYRLIGYSFGGTLAYEIAYLLQNQNEQVDLLAMIDGWAMFSEIQFDENEFKRLMRFYNPELSDSMINLSWGRMQLLLTHRPSSTCQNMLLFKAEKLLEEYQVVDDVCNGWKKYNRGDIEVHPVGGNHETIIYPDSSLVILDIVRKKLAQKM